MGTDSRSHNEWDQEDTARKPPDRRLSTPAQLSYVPSVGSPIRFGAVELDGRPRVDLKVAPLGLIRLFRLLSVRSLFRPPGTSRIENRPSSPRTVTKSSGGVSNSAERQTSLTLVHTRS